MFYHGKRILLLLSFYLTEFIGAAFIKSIRNTAFDNQKVLFNTFITINVPSLMSCTSKCAAKPTCISLNFNQLSGRCVLLEMDFTDLDSATHENGWLYFYIFRDVAKDLPSRCNTPMPTGVCSLFCLRYIYDYGASHAQFASRCSQLDGGEMLKVDRGLKQHCAENLLADKTEKHVYIQGTRDGTSDIWRYDDGTEVTYFNWRTGQPDNTTSRYIAIKYESKWEDVFGIYQHAAICQQN